MVHEQNHAQSDPEGTIGAKCTVSEIVSGLELLVPGHKLGQPAENKPQGHNRPNAAPSEIVKLQNQCGQAKAGQSDDRRVTS
jgi:hypothetical protein